MLLWEQKSLWTSPVKCSEEEVQIKTGQDKTPQHCTLTGVLEGIKWFSITVKPKKFLHLDQTLIGTHLFIHSDNSIIANILYPAHKGAVS